MISFYVQNTWLSLIEGCSKNQAIDMVLTQGWVIGSED